MTDLEGFTKGFLSEWLKTLMESLDKNVDEETRLKIFKETGTFCAKAHATDLFKEIKTKSNDINVLIKILNEKISGTTWELQNGGKLKVTYDRCFCPIISHKLHKSEVQCDCSVGWLKTNLEILFNKEVEVVLKDSVLRGGKQCDFEVTI
ncbi:MAG: hypothetical protein HZR80_08905 [Candidatus Heimdallarchaeota archaeon]